MKILPSFAGALAACIAAVVAAPTAREDAYEYIVVGSGAGGGVVASRLARAGRSVLLIEAGDDQGESYNVTVPGFQAAVTEDPLIRWDIFVNHYQDLARAEQDPKYTYELSDGSYYVGLDPPSGAKPLGILYPRAGTLGGCVSHNALIWITPHASDWDYIEQVTGDSSWSSSNMNQYLAKVYEWLHTGPTHPSILIRDLQLVQQLAGGAAVMGDTIDPLSAVVGLGNALLVNPNAPIPGRDSREGFFQIPLIQSGGARDGVRDFIVDTVNQGYPLTVKTNTYVTKIDFDTSGSTSKATGVEYLEGAYLYKASPLSGGTGTPGSAKASKEVIISGGTYNTVQLLKLSGVGPQDELQSFGIDVVKDSPGVGTNMQDRYEVPVNVQQQKDFSILDGCTFDAKPHDLCYKQWVDNPYVLDLRGAYATDGLAATMAVHSADADNSDIDLYIFGGPVDFTGYFPGWSDFAVKDHNYFSWYTLKAHTRNHAGTVALRSTDPLDTPLINFNYFDTGTTADGADAKDLEALVQAVNVSREALRRYYDYEILGGSNFTEVRPGDDVQTEEEIGDYVKRVAWGHHACCTAAIGSETDDQAVLDSNFRVKGVQNLRVVDASVFPKIPGIFIQAPIFMIAEKAADVILKGS